MLPIFNLLYQGVEVNEPDIDFTESLLFECSIIFANRRDVFLAARRRRADVGSKHMPFFRVRHYEVLESKHNLDLEVRTTSA